MEKTCTVCKKEKDITEFGKRRRSKDGLKSYCKKCDYIRISSYEKTKKGLISRIYYSQTSSSKKRGHNPPEYSKAELSDWLLSQEIFQKLFKDWEDSGYRKMLKPSIDRLDDYKGYSLDRIQITTWGFNFDKGHKDRRNGVNNKMSKNVTGTNIVTGEIVEFHSTMEAERQLGIHHTSIGANCLGKAKTAGKYIWNYKQ